MSKPIVKDPGVPIVRAANEMRTRLFKVYVQEDAHLAIAHSPREAAEAVGDALPTFYATCRVVKLLLPHTEVGYVAEPNTDGVTFHRALGGRWV